MQASSLLSHWGASLFIFSLLLASPRTYQIEFASAFCYGLPHPDEGVRMTENSPEWRLPVAALAPGQSAKFSLRCEGRAVEGFVVNHDGQFYAYVNRCSHAGTPLDLWPNDFFSDDGRHLICATHGAVYLPETGLCVRGPCPGASLASLPVAMDGAEVVISCPEGGV